MAILASSECVWVNATFPTAARRPRPPLATRAPTPACAAIRGPLAPPASPTSSASPPTAKSSGVRVRTRVGCRKNAPTSALVGAPPLSSRISNKFVSFDVNLGCVDTEGAVQDLVSCSNVTGSDTSYCCAGAVNCCDGGVGRFNILPSKPQTWAMWDASSAEYLVVTPLARTGSASRTAVATSATPTPDASGRTRSLTTASQTPAQTGTAPGQSEGSQGSTPSGGLSQGAQAGIGVGAAVGVLLISAVGYLWWKLKRTKKMVEGSQGQGGPKDSPNPAQLPTPFDMAQLPTRSDYTGYDQAKAELPAEQGVYHYGKAELPTAQGVFELQAATTPTYPSRRDSATVPGLS